MGNEVSKIEMKKDERARRKREIEENCLYIIKKDQICSKKMLKIIFKI